MLRIALPIAVALALVASRTSAQSCRADFDSSGAVEVNEIIQVVNEALGSCTGQAATPTRGQRTPTPTRTPTEPPADACPYRFNQAVDADSFCSYEGGATAPPCVPPFSAGGGWIASGMDVVALVIDEFGVSVAVSARRTSPTAAKVNSVALGPDFDNPVAATGNLALPSASRFTVTFKTATGCTVSFDGDFIGVLTDDSRRSRSLVGLRQSLERVDGDASIPKADDSQARTVLREFARRALRDFMRARE